MRSRTLAWKLVSAALLLGSCPVAHAGDLDGVWERDDQKTYRIVENDGIVESPGSDLGCRLHWTRDDDYHLALELRFTRVADEQGWLATKALSTDAYPDAVPDKVELDFDWIDLDAKGKVVARGKETHTLHRTRKLTDAELESTAARLAWHAKIDAYLVAGSPELDLEAASETAARALADEACSGDAVLLRRQKALAAALAQRPRASRTRPPAKVELLSLDPHHSPEGSDHDHGEYGMGKLNARITNLTTRPLVEVTIAVRPLGADGKDSADSQSTSRTLTTPLAPGASVEEDFEIWSPEVRNATRLALDLTHVQLADGLVWEPFDPPLAVKELTSDPIEVEYLGLVASTAREIKDSHAPAQVGAFRLRNTSPAAIESYGMWVHFLAADGKEIDKTGMTAGGGTPLRPGAYWFVRLARALPEGTKSVVAELTDAGFTNKRAWRKGSGLVSPE